MLSYYLRCIKKIEIKNRELQKQKKKKRKEKQCFYQTVQFAITKNQYSSKSNKQKGFWVVRLVKFQYLVHYLCNYT